MVEQQPHQVRLLLHRTHVQQRVTTEVPDPCDVEEVFLELQQPSDCTQLVVLDMSEQSLLAVLKAGEAHRRTN